MKTEFADIVGSRVALEELPDGALMLSIGDASSTFFSYLRVPQARKILLAVIGYISSRPIAEESAAEAADKVPELSNPDDALAIYGGSR